MILYILRVPIQNAIAYIIFTYILEVLLSTGCFQPCLLHLTLQELSGVLPDMMTLAKPLAGGLPIGAVLLTEAHLSKKCRVGMRR